MFELPLVHFMLGRRDGCWRRRLSSPGCLTINWQPAHRVTNLPAIHLRPGIRTITRDRPDRTVVAIVCTQSLSVRGEPRIDNLVLGRGEEKVALGIEDDLSERTLVTYCSLAVMSTCLQETVASCRPTLQNNGLLLRVSLAPHSPRRVTHHRRAF